MGAGRYEPCLPRWCAARAGPIELTRPGPDPGRVLPAGEIAAASWRFSDRAAAPAWDLVRCPGGGQQSDAGRDRRVPSRPEVGPPGSTLVGVTDYAIPGREYALVFATAALVTYLVTGAVRVLAIKIKAVTPIRDRDVHSWPTPRMGGVAVYLGFACAVLMALQLPRLSKAFETSTEIKGVLVAGGVIVLVGVLDDRFDLDAVTKLAGQILAGGILVLFGVQWVQMWVPADTPQGGTTVTFDSLQGAAITVLLTLILANAMNFIDGLDGLLTGVALIAAAGLFVFSVHQLVVSKDDTSASQPPLMAAALIGACLGFWPHNFYPARIFMGDSGSMFIGLAMAAAIISAGGKLDPSTFGGRATIGLLAPLVVVLAVVFIPVLDFLLAVVRRAREGRHPFSADKRHLHHRMLALGHTHRQAVLIFYLWAFVLSAGAVSLVFVPNWQAILWAVLCGILVAVGFSIWPWVRARRLGRRTGSAPANSTGPPASAAPPRPTGSVEPVTGERAGR